MENSKIKHRFLKYADNPVYGDDETGTLFDVYVTREESGLLRMDLSHRKSNTALDASARSFIRVGGCDQPQLCSENRG